MTIKEILEKYGAPESKEVVLDRIKRTGTISRPESIKHSEATYNIGQVWAHCLLREELSFNKACEITALIMEEAIKKETNQVCHENRLNKNPL